MTVTSRNQTGVNDNLGDFGNESCINETNSLFPLRVTAILKAHLDKWQGIKKN